MANTMRVLLARGSFATLGGAEREFINTANQLHKSMKVDLAALDFLNIVETSSILTYL